MKKLLAILIPIVLVAAGLFAQQQLELPLVPPDPAPIHDLTPTVDLSNGLPGLNLPPVSSRQMPDYGPGQATGLPNLSLPPVSSTSSMPTPGGRLPSINLPQTEPDIIEPTFEDFTGGWNTEDFPDNIDDKDALEIENFIWSKRGRLEPRPGYAFYNSTEIESGEHIWGLYRHYKRDRRSVLYVGTPDSLYVDTSQAQSGSFLSTGYGWTDNEEFFDFESFKDYCIVAHKGDTTRILDELDVTALIFGFADSIEQIVCSTFPFSGCTAFVCCDNVDWIPNQWAGYWLSKTMTPYDDNDYYTGLPQMIVGNSEYVLYLGTLTGLPNCGPGDGWRYIFGFFDYDSVDMVVVDTTSSLGGCGTDVVIDDWSTADTIWDGGLHVIRMITGDAAGLEADIKILVTSVFPTDSSIFISDLWGNSENISAGDTALILRSSFWKAELVKAHKNRLFMVVRNNWPESGQFIVFSEYNSVTHFDQDNYFFIRTDDGDKVTQLATFYQDQLGYKDNARDGLVIFKENSIFVLTFIDEMNYYLTQVVEGVGCMAGQTVQVIEGKYMLFLHSTGVYAFDGRTVTLLTKKIDSVIEDIERNPNHDLAAAGYDDRHYYLSYPGAEIKHEGFLISYAVTPGGVTGIYTQALDSDGAQADTQYKDLNEATGYHDLGCNSTGQYIHVWQNTLADSGNIWLQRFNADRSMLGDSIRVNDNLWDPTNYNLTADMNQSGDIVVVWQDNRQESAGTNDIYGQLLSFATGKVGTNFAVNECYEANTWDCGEPDVDINDDGFFVIVWQEYSDYSCLTLCCTGCAMEILGQKYSVSDGEIDDNFLVNDCRECTDDTIKSQYRPSVAVAHDKSFVVTWDSDRGTNTNDVWKQEFTSAGVKVGCDAMISPVTYTHSGYPELAINDSGLYVITWIETAVPSGEIDVFASTFNADHSVKTSGFKVNEDAGNAWDDNQQQVAINKQGIYVIVWSDGRAPNPDNIYAQVYNFYTGASGSNFCINDYPAAEVGQFPEIKCFGSFVPDYNSATIAWSVDFGGWSEIVNALAGLYATQKGLTDTINMIFSDPANRSYVYEFGKVFQDTGQDISVVFKSKAFDFNSISNQKRVTRFFLNYYLDAGSFDLTFYTDFGDTSRYTSTVSTYGGYRYVRVPLDWTCRGRNFSYKIESTDDLRIDKIRLRLKIEED